jgi:hypothetical protein
MEKSCLLAYIENMRRDDVIAKLKEPEPVLRGFGVAALYLFGSHARRSKPRFGRGRLCRCPWPAPLYGGLRALEDALEHKAKIGYSSRDALSPYIRADAERDALRIF